MDLSIILSIVAIVVSVITLLLTEFQGPAISLISSPEFEVNDDSIGERMKYFLSQGYIPTWLDLKPSSFVFANHGGKSGTILAVVFEFSPTNEFKSFFARFSSNVGFSTEQVIPSTIKQGDNKTLAISSTVQTIDWKRTALADALDPALKVDDIITKALQTSKANFERFCDFLSGSKKLGTINCTISFTKGRFRTKVMTEPLLKSRPLSNGCNQALISLREFLQKWENSEPTRTMLLNETKQNLQGITRELGDNLNSLNKQVQEQNINESKLRVDAWKQLCNLIDPGLEKIHWFLIRSDIGLEEKLAELYSEINSYNGLIDDTLARGELRTAKHLKIVNEERSKLNPKVQTVLGRLSELYMHYVP
jgi:hypothetical protein